MTESRPPNPGLRPGHVVQPSGHGPVHPPQRHHPDTMVDPLAENASIHGAPKVHDTSSLQLVDDKPGAADNGMKKIRAYGVAGSNIHEYKRPTNVTKTGAVRVRTFHGKLSDQGMEFLDNLINDWLEAHPDIEIKNVTSTVGMFDGKFKDMALILNIWY